MKKRILAAIAGIALLMPSLHGQSVVYKEADSISTGSRIAHKSIQIGTGAVATIGLTQLLKASVSEMRPDRSDTRSFPSRHSSWAFAGATVVAEELYRHSPWWVLGSHAIASGIGFQRVMAERHYPGDVLAGAALGIGSMELGYWIGDLFYPAQRRSLPQADNAQSASLALATEAVIPLAHPTDEVHFRTALGSRLTLTLPFSEQFAFQASAHLQSTPLMMQKRCFDILNSFGLTLGAQYRRQLSRRWALDASAALGAMRNLKVHYDCISAGSFRADIRAGADCRLTPALSIGADLGYRLTTYSHACSALSLGFITKANF
ncbi:MAG: phosphatase PAP2 family protein [Muribaculaceae bacterium]|nr:phosphatase PAP2 family protein [Muribaculaceae bacterium]